MKHGLLILAAAAAFGCKHQSDTSDAKEFFENSLRRSATTSEGGPIVKLGGCTGFYVANSGNKPIVATARHCVSYSMTDWCNGGGSVYDMHTSETRKCTRVVAGDGVHDIVLIEVEGGTRSGPALRIGGFAPPAKTRLKMLGFPGDPYATGGLMATENCWTTDGQLYVSPYKGTDYWTKGLQDDSYRHNCSTYGGNSGGPMIIEGTDVAVGLPFQYKAGEYGNQDFTEFSHGAAIADLISVHRVKLDAEGITILNQSPGAGAATYFRAARYVSPDLSCEFYVIPLYLTSPHLTKLKVRYAGCPSGGDEYNVYECDLSAGHCVYKNSYLYQFSATGFMYQSPSGSKSKFTLQ